MPQGKELWKSRLSEEVSFWEKAITWPELVERRNPDMPLQNRMRQLLGPKTSARILDVGAGPLTAVGKKWDGCDISVVAVDPLAEEYDKILAEHNIVPPVRTILLCGEDVSSLPANSFDITYARNCLDHSFDPIAAFRSMLSVTKQGGVVFLQHMVREADNEQRQGLHQWNFYNEGSTFFVESTSGDIVNVNEVFYRVAITTATLVTLYEKSPAWLEVVMVKR